MADLAPLMVSLFDGYDLDIPSDVVQYAHDCDPASCEIFQGAKDNDLNLIGLEAKGVVCPSPLKRYTNPDSIYLRVLANREILPYVFFGGVERRALAKHIKEALEATNQCLSNSPIAMISTDIMEHLVGRAEGRQQCLKTTWSRVVVQG